MLKHGFLPPIKNAKTHRTLHKNYLNRPNFFRARNFEKGGYRWLLQFYNARDVQKDEPCLACSLSCTDNPSQEMLIEYRVVVLNYISSDKSSGLIRRAWLKKDNLASFSDFVCSRDLIASENGGYLEDGNLTILFQVRIHFFVDQNLGGHLNFLDPVDECFVFHSRGNKLYVQKKFLHFHSPVLASMIDLGINQIEVNCGIRVFKDILKTMHGSSASEYRMDLQLSFATRFKMYSVVRVLEKKLIDSNSHDATNMALNLPRLYKRCLKDIETVQELRESVKNANIDLMSLELMKILVLKFFSFAKPFRIPN